MIYFGVKFCPLYRNLEEAFRSKRISSIGMGAIIPNKHICLVVTGATVLIRNICSPNCTSVQSKRVVPEQTHPFGLNKRNRYEQTHPFDRNGLSPNKHIYSVETNAIVPTKHICSPNRHMFVKQTHSYITFNVGLKSFHTF